MEQQVQGRLAVLTGRALAPYVSRPAAEDVAVLVGDLITCGRALYDGGSANGLRVWPMASASGSTAWLRVLGGVGRTRTGTTLEA